MARTNSVVNAIYQFLTGGVTPDPAARGASGLGIRINRAAAADNQNAAEDIFTIAGGMIYLTSLVGIRTVIQAGGASNMSFAHDNGPTNLCLAAAVTGDLIGNTASLAGDAGDALIMGVGGGVLNTTIPSEPAKLVATSLQYGSLPMFLLGIGNITVLYTAVAGTGSTRYVMTYIPLDDGVTVVPA